MLSVFLLSSEFSVIKKFAYLCWFSINGELKIVYKKTRSTPLRSDEIAEIEPFLQKYHKKIADKWKQVFILNEPVTMEEVKRKIK